MSTAARDTLRVRMPDGQWRAFCRLFDSRARRPLEVRMRAPDSRKVHSGLAEVVLDISGGGDFVDSTYRLVLESREPTALRHERALQLVGWPRRLRLVLNTHLLPDGKRRFNVRLARGSRDVWRSSFALSVRNEGALADQVRASLRNRGTPVVLDDLVDSTQFDIANRSLQPWFEQDDALERLEGRHRAGRITAPERELLRAFVEDGYVVLPMTLEESLLGQLDRELADAVARKVDGYEFGTSQRIVNLHQRYAGVKALWRHPQILRYLELIFEAPPRPCQTLTYVFGSEQDPHQDTIHLTPFPAGYMCGVWVALEDVRPDSGELEVFPGSHRLPRVYMSAAGCAKVEDDWTEFSGKVVARYRAMLAEGGFARVSYRPKRGTVLVWHENLLHGGGKRIDPSLTRRSIVSHYFADGAIAFYDSTGLAGNMDPAS
jgi:hypothetical protein